ncbi:MAG TPA: hypothetical protein VK826_17730 [Bacteroidia bacterium]|nr:hypothetical protein [Bacteroidia bacterium]
MLRIAVCLLLLFAFSACNKNWRGLVIQKRVYMDGYYVHLPWKRKAPVNAYPKPEPFPVDHSRTAATDSVRSSSGSPASIPNTPATATTQPTPVQPNDNSGGTGLAPPATATATATGPPLPTEQPVDPGYYRVPVSPDTTVPKPTDIATDPNLPGTDTVAIADEPPQRDKGFEFPDGEFALTAELGFFGPAEKNGIQTRAKSFSTGGGLRYTVNASSRHGISADAGVHMSIFDINQGQRKQKPMFTEPHGKERILMLKTRFMVMDRIFITRNASARFDRLEVGIFSEMNFFSTHVALDQYGNDASAALTRHKTRLFGLHYIRCFQYGATIRLANEKLAIFANYRLNKLVKGDPDGGDLPKLLFSVELRLGE